MEKLRWRMNQQSCYWNTRIVSWGMLVSGLWIWAPFAWTNCLLMGGRDHQTFPLLHFHTLHYSLIPISHSTTSVDTPCFPRGVCCVIHNVLFCSINVHCYFDIINCAQVVYTQHVCISSFIPGHVVWEWGWCTSFNLCTTRACVCSFP